MRFPEEFVEQVKIQNNIVDVASKYTPLKQKGRQHWGLCPFHNEKTPSFAINEQQQFFKCFGCGQAGNVITLVKQFESTDYAGALELLAGWAGIPMPAVKNDPQYAEKKKKKERVLECLEHARSYYCENLYKENNKGILEYLHRRGIGDDLIKMFNIGASSSWEEVVTLLRNKGYSDLEIYESGVAAKSDKGRLYDAMGERVTFAIFDLYGSCIGFTGRTLSQDKNIAKYRNSAQSIVFDKGSIIYGVDVLKRNKSANFVDSLIVVEGNVDVIALVGAGFTNTVACMGTAMTKFHAAAFKRFSPNIYLCFDGDKSGVEAAVRATDVLAEQGLNVRVVSLPVDTDPDSYIVANGKDAFAVLLDEAKPMIDFKLDKLLGSSDLRDNIGKSTYLKEAVKILKPLAGTPDVELYLPKVTKNAGVSALSILNALGTKVAERPPDLKLPIETVAKNKYTNAIDYVLACLVQGVAVELPQIDLRDKVQERLLHIVQERREAGKLINPGLIPIDEGDEDMNELVKRLASTNIDLGEMHLTECIKVINQCCCKERIDQLTREYEKTKDVKILHEIQDLQKRSKR